MCQPKSEGGKRCAAHTRPAYEAAMLDIKGGTDAERVTRVDGHRQALIDHACTPSGAKELLEARALFEETYSVFPSTNTQQEKDRQSLLATLALVQVQSEIRASVEEQVRRRSRHDRTGSHVELPMTECTPQSVPTATTTAETAAASTLPTAPDTTGYERVDTTVRHLQAGDVLSGSGFVVTHTPYSGVRLKSGKLYVEGYYPGKAPRRHEWGASTTLIALRAPR
jgi:hypothetical protein